MGMEEFVVRFEKERGVFGRFWSGGLLGDGVGERGSGRVWKGGKGRGEQSAVDDAWAQMRSGGHVLKARYYPNCDVLKARSRHVSEQWDEDLVKHTFFEEDAKVILSIPIHPELDDVVAWHYDPKGMFTVRLAHNSIAVRMELQRRGMELDTKCVVCNRLNEDGGHLFFKCKYAVKVWKLLNLDGCRAVLANKQSAKEVVCHIILLKAEEQMRVIVLLWQWWQERNKIREGDRRRTAEDLAYIVQKQASEFLKEDTGIAAATQRTKKRWNKPRPGVLKINTDGLSIPILAMADGALSFATRTR
ncbi:hypothetical protein C2845_PM18G07680 [Panicum miliaceum]|uniref:Reverse transcriptase zinc-binding domain-containing protein n=1 Tax=Panicum miliaceum TaxID=4540 RepID=A0A3L6PLE8_PANMI|nr:hypothetical protein C2845_PM18G07680 [Panicum miliaceum]